MYINVGSSGDALNLSNLLKDGDWMVLYYAEWCGHCQTMKPEWNKVVNKMKNNNNLNIAEIESNHIDNLINKPTIEGFPTIKMYNNGKEIANFEDERVADKMEKFAMTNSKKYVMKPKSVKSRTMKPKSVKSRTMKPKSIKSRTMKPKSIKSRTIKPKSVKSRTIKSRTMKTKSVKSGIKKNIKKNYDLKKSTKSVFSKLINSFDRISNEAKKDAKLLKEAKHLL